MTVRHPFLAFRGPIAMAHRGGAGEAPENSRAAFQNAFDLGFRYVETDVRATRDGHALILHDATVDRVSSASGGVGSMTLAQIQEEVLLADGQAPLTLVEALGQWPTMRLNVDLKEGAVIAPFLRAVEVAQAWDRVCAASFSSARLRTVRRLGGGRLATSLGLIEVVSLIAGSPTPKSPVAAQVPPRSLGSRFPVITSTLVRRAHRRGLAVHAWTVDDAEEVQRLLALGVDGIITDRPSLVREALLRAGAWDQNDQ